MHSLAISPRFHKEMSAIKVSFEHEPMLGQSAKHSLKATQTWTATTKTVYWIKCFSNLLFKLRVQHLQSFYICLWSEFPSVNLRQAFHFVECTHYLDIHQLFRGIHWPYRCFLLLFRLIILLDNDDHIQILKNCLHVSQDLRYFLEMLVYFLLRILKVLIASLINNLILAYQINSTCHF